MEFLSLQWYMILSIKPELGTNIKVRKYILSMPLWYLHKVLITFKNFNPDHYN